MLAARKDMTFQVITATLVGIAFASGIATVPEEFHQTGTASQPAAYSADEGRLTN